MEGAKGTILNKLKENNLDLNDKSSPKRIKDLLQMSKKAFKKAIGGLYKERVIKLAEENIRFKTNRVRV